MILTLSIGQNCYAINSADSTNVHKLFCRDFSNLGTYYGLYVWYVIDVVVAVVVRCIRIANHNRDLRADWSGLPTFLCAHVQEVPDQTDTCFINAKQESVNCWKWPTGILPTARVSEHFVFHLVFHTTLNDFLCRELLWIWILHDSHSRTNIIEN